MLFVFVRILLLFALNLIVLSSAILIQRAVFPAHRYTLYERLLIIALLIWSQIVLLLLGLGLSGLISYRYALIGALLILAVVVAMTHWRSMLDLRLPKPSLEWLTDWSVDQRRLLLGGLAFLMVLSSANLIAPPGNWDSLNYHLYIPAQWYKQGSLVMTHIPFGDMAPPYYPLNVELIYLWLILPVDALAIADVGQSLFVPLVAVALYAVARQSGIEPKTARWAACLTLFVPMVTATGAIWSTNDVVLGAIWLTALAFSMRASKTTATRDLLIAGVALGLLLGTKGFAIPIGSLIIPWILIGLWRRLQFSGSKFWSALGAWAGSTALLGGFSYTRNFILTGNPLFPYRFSFGPLNLPGVIDRAWFVNHPFHQFNLTYLPLEIGYLPIWILVLFACPALISLILARHSPLRQPLLVYVGLIIAFVIIFMAMFPIRAVRFLLAPHALLLLMACVGLTMPMASDRLQRAALPGAAGIGAMITLLIAVLALGSNVFAPEPVSLHLDLHAWPVVIHTFQTITLFTLLQYLVPASLIYLLLNKLINSTPNQQRWISMLICVGVTFGLSFGLVEYDRREYEAYQRAHYADLGKLWRWLNKESAGARIAYIGSNVPLPLFGHHLHAAAVQPINVGPGALLHEIESPAPFDQPIVAPPSGRSSPPSQSAWLANLAAARIDLIVVFGGDNWPELAWMRADPTRFTQIYDGPAGSVWRVQK